MLRIQSYGALLFLLLTACTSDEVAIPREAPALLTSATIPNSLQQVRNDMRLPHEAIPRGVPEGMDWRSQPRVGYGNTPPAGWSAMITWGQVYAAAGHRAPPNTRVQIKNMQTWYFSRQSGEWINWQRSSEVGGANYNEDFQNDTNQPADIRKEAVGYSATIPDGVNFHFWPQEGRVQIEPEDIEAVWTAIDARLVLDDSTRTDDRGSARLMMSAGADYWLDRAAEWDQWKTNGDIGIGRFRFVTPDWQTYNMHTISDSIFAANPPPVD